MNHPDHRHIPLEQRFQTGRVINVDLGVLHLALPESCKWAKRARVREEELVEGMGLADYKTGNTTPVFLLNPSAQDPDLFQASIRWADRGRNPWLTTPPKKGQVYEVTAIGYLPTLSGVFVELPSGIDSLLRLSEIPGEHTDVSMAVDIGDQLVVQIIDVRPERLQVDASVRQALKTLRTEEKQRRLREFDQETIRTLPRKQWALPRREGLRIAVLGPDIYFSNHLVPWLDALGLHALRVDDSGHLARILGAANRPTHLLADPARWSTDRREAQQLKDSLQSHKVETIWLKGDDYPSLLPFSAPVLPLPLHLGDLLNTLEDPAYQPAARKKTGRFQFSDYQSQHVQRLANRLLAHICEENRLEAALWVVRERAGVFTARAWHGLEHDEMDALQPELGNTLFATSIEQNTQLERPVYKTGPLKRIAPTASDTVLCIPLPYVPLNGEEVVERAVVFFYRHSAHPRSLSSRIRSYLPAMQSMVETLYFAQHNAMLTAFANLGLNSASYLHELGQAAQPVQAFLHQHSGAETPPEATEWRDLKKNLDRLVTLAGQDLAGIQRQGRNQLQLKDRLAHIARLYTYRASEVNCAFRVSLPDYPLMLSLPPLVIDQVVNNLLDNAHYFVRGMQDWGRVEVEVRLYPEQREWPLIIDVIDNGPGIRAHMDQKLFSPRDSAKVEGTGMGLFIARGFLRGIGGDLTLVKSVLWKQTRFRIHLPVILGQLKRGRR